VILPFELMLVLGAIAVYVFDSSMLLCTNEMVIVHKWPKCTISLPSSRWELLRKHPYIPNPFTPHHGLIRTTWYPKAEINAGYDSARLLEMDKCIRPIQAVTLSLLTLMVFALPFSLLVARTHFAFLIVIAAIYSHIIFMLVIIFFRRQTLRLAKREFAKLAFDSLACAPLAINVIRKLYLRQSLSSNTLAFMKEVCGGAAVAEFATQLTRRVDEMQNGFDDGSIEANNLAHFKRQLQKFTK
jgi:hypothetical protein